MALVRCHILLPLLSIVHKFTILTKTIDNYPLHLGRIGKKIKPIYLIPFSAAALGLLVIIIVNSRILPVILVLVALVGFTVIGFFVSILTLLQGSVKDEFRGRIFGAFGNVQAVTMLIGMGLASGLGDTIGVVMVLDIAGIFNILAGVIAFVMMPRPGAKMTVVVEDGESVATVQERGFETEQAL
jgi:MFS family permease